MLGAMNKAIFIVWVVLSVAALGFFAAQIWIHRAVLDRTGLVVGVGVWVTAAIGFVIGLKRGPRA